MENSQSSTVLICGAGPTGLTAALELSRLKIPVRLIEKTAEPATTSRAVGVQPRTLELFEQRGLVEPMLERGHKVDVISIHGQGKRIAKIDFTQNGSNYPHMLFVSQCETEAILRSQLEKQGVTIERSVEFVALSQSDPDRRDHVKAILKHRDGSLEEFNCAYLISTEGAHSIARTTVNVNFNGESRDEIYILGDVCMETDLSIDDVHTFPSEHGLFAIIPLGKGNRFRIVAASPLSTPTNEKMPSLEELQKIYDMRAYIPARLSDMTWSTYFRISSRMTDRLRVGRVLFGGDSAHIHSPVGAQGMNTGIQDMINLAWKLALVIKGQANPKLLDTYDDDRIPVIRGVVTRTHNMTDAMGSQSVYFRLASNYIVPWFASSNFVQKTFATRVGQLSLNYRNSPISVSHKPTGQLRGGDRIPNLKVQTVGGEGEGTPKSLFHFLNTDRFTLLFANPTKAEATHQSAYSAQSSLDSWKTLIQTYTITPVADQELGFRTVLGAQSSLVLVRPDGYVAFIGTENSIEALVNYLNTWFPTHQKQANA